MSFHEKGFWMPKGGSHLTNAEERFDNSSRVEAKRSHQWFTDAAEPELFPNKKLAVQSPNSKSISGIPTTSLSWGNSSSFQGPPNQFLDRLFGSETPRPVNFTERNISSGGTDKSHLIEKNGNGELGNNSSLGLPMSYAIEDPENYVSYGGIRKVKVNQVKDSDSGMLTLKEQDNNLSVNQVFDRGNESSFISMGQTYCKDDGNFNLMGHTYTREEATARSTAPTVGKDEENALSIGHFNPGDSHTISFGGFQGVTAIDNLSRPIDNYGYIKDMNNYNLSYDPSSVQTVVETAGIKELDVSNAITVANSPQVSKSKNKSETKSAKKEAPNSFPSNVRSLIATGILDGVPIKYVSLSREELPGIIKGTGYLCGCQACNYSKALNAFELERHAGCKTKHPNNHIYFENGKTIYQIVQELKSTPTSMLFDAIQTVTGSPINQKAFRSWKESFQAATRELQRIYGREDLNTSL